MEVCRETAQGRMAIDRRRSVYPELNIVPGTTRVITVSFRLTTRDFYRAMFWINVRKFWFLIQSLPICITYAALSSSEQNALPASLGLTALWGMVTFMVPYLGARAALRNRNFEHLIQCTFSAEGMDVVAKHSSGHMAWIMVTRVTESKHYVMIMVAGNLLHLIPKACFSSEDFKSFKDLLGSSVSGKVGLKD